MHSVSWQLRGGQISFDVEIRIFGTVSEPRAVQNLANNAAAEGKSGWLYDFDQDGFAHMIEQAEAEERALVLTRPNTTDFFDGVRSSCQEAGLSYVMTYGQRGAEGFSEGLSWRPEMGEEVAFFMHGGQATLGLADVRKAARHGLEAVHSLVDQVASTMRVGSIVVAPRFWLAYQEESGFEAPAPNP